MHLVYIDDSGDNSCRILSALAIPAASWRDSFDAIKKYRKSLKASDNILVTAEFHAWKFVSGRGYIAPSIVSVGRRCEIFKESLQLMASLPGARLFNAYSTARDDLQIFEWLLNRVNKMMEVCDSHAILICDQGKETQFTQLSRKMMVYNPIPSQHGVWRSTGTSSKNIPILRIIEDPVFKDSARSYFIQFVDFAAYALLRRERPLASKTKYGLDKAFDLLSPILVREASRKDPDGIIRIAPRP